jgi:hypothetical protein
METKLKHVVPNDVNVVVITGITYPSIACHVSGKVFVYNMLYTNIAVLTLHHL